MTKDEYMKAEIEKLQKLVKGYWEEPLDEDEYVELASGMMRYYRWTDEKYYTNALDSLQYDSNPIPLELLIEAIALRETYISLLRWDYMQHCATCGPVPCKTKGAKTTKECIFCRERDKRWNEIANANRLKRKYGITKTSEVQNPNVIF